MEGDAASEIGQDKMGSELDMSGNIPVKAESEKMSSFKVESAQAVEDLIEEGDQALPDEFPEDMSMSAKKSAKSKQSSKG